MPYTNQCRKLLTVFALSFFLAGLMPAKVIANSEPEDPPWLPDWQQITQSQTDSEAVLLMEAFLYAHSGNEDALETIAVPYLLQAGMNIKPQVEALASNNKSPVIQGLLTFLHTLEEDDRLLSEQKIRSWAQQLYEALAQTWRQKNQRQALYDQALREVSAFREQQPDSLTLTWLAAQLHQLKPDGGHWQAERVWEHWTAGSPDRDTPQAQAYKKTPYPATGKLPAVTKEWAFFGLKGAEAFAERPVRITPGASGTPYLPAQQQARFRQGFHEFSASSHRPHDVQHNPAGTDGCTGNVGSKTAAFMGFEFDEESRELYDSLSSTEQYEILRVAYQNKEEIRLAGLGRIVKAASKVILSRLSSTSKAVLKEFGYALEDLITDANKPINKEGLTKAARALTKHASGQRATGTFPKLTGGITKQNETAQKIVEDILNNPKASYTRLPRGDLEVRAPDGKGLRFKKDGSFSAFLDPKEP